MKRKPQIVEAMGLGPIWLQRDSTGQPCWLDAPAGQPVAEEAPVDMPQIAGEAIVEAAPAPIQTRHEAPPAAAATVCVDSDTPTATTELSLLSWEALQNEVQNCQRCRLGQTRSNAVFGRGHAGARWLLVGEAPGEQEDRQGLPFVGRAGKLLDNMLAASGLSTETEVYIANVLKCRPPGNRNPQGDEIAACQSFLHQQIRHIQPEIIVALGRFAAQTLLETGESISRLRGRVHHYRGIPMIVTFHPAYLLRNPPDKSKAWQDWILAKNTLA